MLICCINYLLELLNVKFNKQLYVKEDDGKEYVQVCKAWEDKAKEYVEKYRAKK